MNFQEAEKTYKDLRTQHAAGKMTDADFEAQVNQLKVQDAQGRWWQLGVRTGEWYFNDGQKWVKGKPPTASTPPPAPAEEKPAPAPVVTPPPVVTPTPSPMAAASEPTPTISASPAMSPSEEKTERPSVMPRGLFAAKPEGSNGGGGLPKPVLIGIIAVVAVVILAVLVGAYFLFGRGPTGGTTAARTPTTAVQVAAASPTQAIVQITATPASTNTPEATSTLVISATNTVAPAARATNTRAPVVAARTNTPTKAPAASATPQPPPGLFVTKIVVDTASPDPNVKFGFRVSFLNNNAPPSFFGRDVKWFLGISRVNDQDKLYGQTEQKTLDIRNGAFEVSLPQSYQIGASGPPDCYYIWMAYYFDELGVRQKFTNTDGKPLQLRFDMCK